MTEILNYFDLNNRMTTAQATSAALIDQQQNTTTNLFEEEGQNGDQSVLPESDSAYDEDPLYNDMDKYWSNYGNDQEKTKTKEKTKDTPFDNAYEYNMGYISKDMVLEKPSMLDTIFSFVSKMKPTKPSPKNDTLSSIALDSKLRIPWWQQIVLYSGIIIGTTITSTVVEHQAGSNYLFEISLPTVILSSILAIIISPVAIQKLCLTVSGSFFTRFFLFIQNGVFWYVLISAYGFTLDQFINIST